MGWAASSYWGTRNRRQPIPLTRRVCVETEVKTSADLNSVQTYPHRGWRGGRGRFLVPQHEAAAPTPSPMQHTKNLQANKP